MNAFASYDRLGQSMTNYAKPNAPTLKCPATTETYGGSYRLKAGLITADELAFAGENPGVITDSYLSPIADGSMTSYWSMSPAYFNGGHAFVWVEAEALGNYYVDDGFSGLRPVINLLTDNGFTSGDGTASNPYVIS